MHEQTAHKLMLISVWGLSAEWSWIEVNWIELIVFVLLLFLLYEFAHTQCWIFAHCSGNHWKSIRMWYDVFAHTHTKAKNNTFIKSLQHMCALEFVDTVMLDLFSHSINESNSAMPFFSLSSNLKQISKWNALTFHHINDWYDRFRIVCILLPHVEFTFQVDWNLNSKFIEIQFTYWTSYILIISSTTSTTTTTTMTTRHTK